MRRGVLLSLGLLMLGGCASHPSEPLLAEGESLLDSLRQQPAVRDKAALDLQRAEETLLQARRHAEHWGGAEDARHYARLSRLYAEIARLHGALAEKQELIARRERTLDRLQFATAELQRWQQQGLSEDPLFDLATSDTERGLVITLGDVFFESGSSRLSPLASRTLLKLARHLHLNPERRVRIEGYADNRGGAEQNQALSLARAQAVEALLLDLGVAEARLEVVGYGERYPLAENASSRGRALNRRVEILLSDEAGQLAPPR